MDTRPGLMPKARKDRLIIKELPDETLVYDLDTDKAHCLNEMASIVWKNCDGISTVQEVTAFLSERYQSAVDEQIIALALDKLRRFNLLEGSDVPVRLVPAVNRRDWVRTVGISTIALPLIVALTAPPAQAQGSCIVKGGNCSPPNSPGGCCSGCMCNGSGKCAGSCA